jgi:hypothetical protein
MRRHRPLDAYVAHDEPQRRWHGPLTGLLAANAALFGALVPVTGLAAYLVARNILIMLIFVVLGALEMLAHVTLFIVLLRKQLWQQGAGQLVSVSSLPVHTNWHVKQQVRAIPWQRYWHLACTCAVRLTSGTMSTNASKYLLQPQAAFMQGCWQLPCLLCLPAGKC